MMKIEWEHIGDRTYRLKIPGGWLVKNILYSNKDEPVAQTMCVVSDASGGWLKDPFVPQHPEHCQCILCLH